MQLYNQLIETNQGNDCNAKQTSCKELFMHYKIKSIFYVVSYFGRTHTHTRARAHKKKGIA